MKITQKKLYKILAEAIAPVVLGRRLNEAGFGPGSMTDPQPDPVSARPRVTYGMAKKILSREIQGYDPTDHEKSEAAWDFAKKKMGDVWVSKITSLMGEINDMANYGGPNDPYEAKLIKQMMNLFNQF